MKMRGVDLLRLELKSNGASNYILSTYDDLMHTLDLICNDNDSEHNRQRCASLISQLKRTFVKSKEN